MNLVFQNTLAVTGGLLVGSAVNMTIITLGPMVIDIPEGVDFSTLEGLKRSMLLLETRHFISPFLAHALGSLAGAFLTAKIALSHQMKLALVIGVFFSFGGIMMAFLVGGPVWFTVVDLFLAYIPMSYLGCYYARAGKSKQAH
mgnify:CR=1 FL=1